MLKGKNVLVTGATGFIGSNLAEKLVLEKANVTILKRKTSSTKNIEDFEGKINTAVCDLGDIVSLRKTAIKHLPSEPTCRSAVPCLTLLQETNRV